MPHNRFSTDLAPDVPFISVSLAILLPYLLFLLGLSNAGVAQLVEHLICNQRVGGSIPSASSTRVCMGSEAERILAVKNDGLVSFDTSPFCAFFGGRPGIRELFSGH
jgi:hypothetical protein